MNDTDLSHYRIIAVDDEPVVLSLLTDMLEDEGYVVETAPGGKEALELLKQEKTHLMITDVRMPEMDGIELVRRARDYDSEIGFIFMTGYADLNSAKDAIKQGAYDYILKPFEISEIRQSVHKAITKIEQESLGRKSGQQLEELSSLNELLLTAGDRQSVCTVSLKFAMMHRHAEQGAILYWDRNRSACNMIMLDGQKTDDRSIHNEMMTKALTNVDQLDFTQPKIVSSIEEHPLLPICPDPTMAKDLMPPWFDGSSPIIVIPIRRSDSLYGVLMIGSSDKTMTFDSSDIKLMTLAANQLALSLENLFLLEESQTAYTRLKELQDETIQLEKMASRGEMSAEIGHELNNFLGVVAGNISLVEVNLKKQQMDKVDKSMRVINDNIKRMTAFTANLMDLKPVASHKEIQRFDSLIAEVVDYLRPQKRFNGVEIDLIAPEQPIPFDFDSTHIQQLLYNLFNNAADATIGRPERRIQVQTQVDQEKSVFTVTISDTGIGVSDELASKMFCDKFTTKDTGHGFGLLVCRRIVDNHGGKISVESTPGEGTSISVEFPLATMPNEQPELSYS